MRTRKLSIQVAAHGEGEYCLSVVQTEWGARGNPIPSLVYNRWVVEDQVLDEVRQLTERVMRHELELWDSGA